ncbi:Calmodulin-binding domain plant domain-containing protein [Dioscorea alata]|uniref:Calmodulin-binding domain plant domain-containing protein n=1 Tax=Dioscorea alata TaxID=55571 RepID=A0ACB7VDA0_DIOAL|nr:Calmodulin-binding domain plant domain-containing protein [Dioscorea alata]
MATEPKEISTNQKSRSSSAPSTPKKGESGKTKLANSSETVTTPHYLKPTISSGNIACKNVKKQPCLTSRRSLDKPSPQSKPPVKTAAITPKSPPAPSKHIITEKASKTVSYINPPKLSRAKSLPKGAISVTKKTKSDLNEKKLSVHTSNKEAVQQARVDQRKIHDVVEHHKVPSPKEIHGTRALEKNVQSKLKIKEKEKVAVDGEEMEDESMAVKKKGSPKGNDVIEETAKKLTDRRNKVKALVGAFETVMSLQETDGQHSPQQTKENVLNSHMEDEGQESQQQIKENTDMDTSENNAVQHEEETRENKELGKPMEDVTGEDSNDNNA